MSRPIKAATGLLLFLTLLVSAHPEIIKLSQLKTEAGSLKVSRDLFSLKPITAPGPGQADPRRMGPGQGHGPGNQPEEPEQISLEQEVSRSIQYEGFISRASQPMALLTVNGEDFYTTENELLINKIKIIKIEATEITIELNDQQFKIRRKGVDDV